MNFARVDFCQGSESARSHSRARSSDQSRYFGSRANVHPSSISAWSLLTQCRAVASRPHSAANKQERRFWVCSIAGSAEQKRTRQDIAPHIATRQRFAFATVRISRARNTGIKTNCRKSVRVGLAAAALVIPTGVAAHFLFRFVPRKCLFIKVARKENQ